jgi:hypothetical protein
MNDHGFTAEARRRRNWILGGNRDTHVHVVRHEVSLQNLALLLPGQCMEDRTQLPAGVAEDGLPPLLGHEHYVILAVPFGMG